MSAQTEPFEILPRPLAAGDDLAVTMRRAEVVPTADQALWAIIRRSTNALSFEHYCRFMERVLCGEDAAGDAGLSDRQRALIRYKSLPFPDVEAYRLLKVATEVFMMINCGADLADLDPDFDLTAESRRFNRTLQAGEIRRQWLDYLRGERVHDAPGKFIETLPYLGIIRMKLRDVPIVTTREVRGEDEAAAACYGILAEKLSRPCFLELIWSYWHEEGMLVQTLNAISLALPEPARTPPPPTIRSPRSRSTRCGR